MTEYPIDIVNAVYLGNCHAKGWTPNPEGLEKFRADIQSGKRDERGVIQWPEKQSCFLPEEAQSSSC